MYIVFDIGGTKTRIAKSDNGQKLTGEPIIFETPKNFETGINKIIETFRALTENDKLEKIAGGIAGPLNREKTRLVNSPNLPNWVNKPLKEKLEKTFNCPVVLENDSAVAALGEANFGAGQGQKIVAYITVSTGVGGARIVNGKIDENIFGFEPGWSILDLDKTLVKNSDGTAEKYLSGTHTQKEFDILAKDMNEKIWDELATRLSALVKNVICFWSPSIIVLGGGMIIKTPGGIPLDKVKENLTKSFHIFPQYSKIQKAKLGETSGLLGSLTLL